MQDLVLKIRVQDIVFKIRVLDIVLKIRVQDIVLKIRVQDLSVGIPGAGAASTCLLGAGEQSTSLSQRLSAKLGKQESDY